MLPFGKREVDSIRFGRKIVLAAYLGVMLVWSSVTSCFSSGWWIDSAPWSDDEAWKD